MGFTHFDHGIVLPKLSRKTTEKGRVYLTPSGNSYPSITTVLSILSKDSIQKWRERVGDEEANRISKKASTRGTIVHTLAEKYLDNDPAWDDLKKKTMPQHLFSFNTIKPIIDSSINNVWFQEVFLFSDKLKTAGQVDCIAEFKGELAVIDFKTSKRPKTADQITSYFMQIAFYAAAFYEMTGVAIKKGVVLMVVDGHEPSVFEFDTFDYLEHFLITRKQYEKMYGL